MILKNMDAGASNGRGHPIDQGIKGEEQVAFYLKQEFVDDPDILVIHDLRLRNGNDDYAQTDHLVIDTRRRIAWTAETKNYNGTLSCNRHGDWEVAYDRRVYQIESPAEQSKRHATSLKRFLHGLGFKDFNIQPIVLLHPTMKVERAGLPGDVPVIKSDNFASTIRKQQQQVAEARPLSSAESQRLGQELLRAHRPGPFNRENHQIWNSRPDATTGDQQGQGRNRRRGTSDGQKLALVAITILIMLFAYKVALPAVFSKLTKNLQHSQNPFNTDAAAKGTGTLIVRDMTGNAGTKQVTAISVISGKTATIFVKAGQSSRLSLRPAIYRIEGSAGGYRVSFGTIAIAAGRTGEIRMGDPRQKMTVIEAAQ